MGTCRGRGRPEAPGPLGPDAVLAAAPSNACLNCTIWAICLAHSGAGSMGVFGVLQENSTGLASPCFFVRNRPKAWPKSTKTSFFLSKSTKPNFFPPKSTTRSFFGQNTSFTSQNQAKFVFGQNFNIFFWGQSTNLFGQNQPNPVSSFTIDPTQLFRQKCTKPILFGQNRLKTFWQQKSTLPFFLGPNRSKPVFGGPNTSFGCAKEPFLRPKLTKTGGLQSKSTKTSFFGQQKMKTSSFGKNVPNPVCLAKTHQRQILRQKSTLPSFRSKPFFSAKNQFCFGLKNHFFGQN